MRTTEDEFKTSTGGGLPYFKRAIRSGFLIFGVFLLLSGCQPDAAVTGEITQEKKIQRVSLNDFKNEVINNEAYTSISQYFDTNEGLHKNSTSSGNNFILTPALLKIDKETGASYTFRIARPAPGNEFYNLVVDVDPDGAILKSAILKYSPSAGWLADPSQPFSGEVRVQNDTVFFTDGSINFREATGSCYEAVWEWECNAGNEHAPNTCTAGGSDLIITYFEVPCAEEGSGGSVSFPVGDGNAPSGPGGGGGSPGGNGSAPDTTMSSPIGPGENTVVDAAFFDEHIFIDDSFKAHPCLKAVYDAMGKATKFTEYLHNFEPGASAADLRFLANDNFGEDPKNQEYLNAMAITDPPLASNLITITFNTDSQLNSNILTKPDAYKAVAMIHEILHAEMYRKMLDAVRAAEINQTNLNWTIWTEQEFKQYIEALGNKYSGILDYFTRYKWQVPEGQQPTSWQHQQMAQHYRDIIKQALTDYDPALTEEQKEALSWLGLKDATIVAWQHLTDEEKTSINDTLSQIKNTFPNGCD